MRPMITRAAIAAAALAIPFFAQPAPLGAQQRDAEREARIERLPDGVSIFYGLSNRPVLGVTLGEPSNGTTDGVRVESVDPDGPASKSGLRAGDVITEIDGVSLRVSPDDARDPALRGIAQRRLQRTLARAKAGDNIELRVQSGGQTRTVTVKTVAASELAGNGTGTRVLRSRSSDDDRGSIGLSIGGSGSVRDTLGLFVSAVVANGPAEKAGVVEGDRIAAVNGVDVRVPREDVDDGNATSARANRFIREVQKVAPGSTLSLRVYAGGRYRDVTVTAVKPSELPSQGFRMSIGDGGFSFDVPRGTVYRAPMGRQGMGRVRTFTVPDGQRLLELEALPGRIRINGDDVLTFDREAFRRSMDELRRNLQDMGRDLRLQLRSEDGDPVIVRTAPRRIIQRS